MVRLALVASALFLVFLPLSPVFADTGSFPVVFGNTYQINYNANGVKIQDIEPNPTYDELTITVQVSSQSASLDLTIPRALLDSKDQHNNDTPFLAVVDGTPANVEEKAPTATTRTISLQLTPDNKQIEIIGTYIVTPGPNGGVTQSPPSNSAPQTPPLSQMHNHTVSQTSPYTKNSTTQSHPSKVTPKTPPSITQGNTQSKTNTGGNIVFTIPYIPNATIHLSPIDCAVIGAISIVIVIVIASTARKRPKL